jgi:hypothetical protein
MLLLTGGRNIWVGVLYLPVCLSLLCFFLIIKNNTATCPETWHIKGYALKAFNVAI